MHADCSALLKGKVNKGSLLSLQAASYLGPHCDEMRREETELGLVQVH